MGPRIRCTAYARTSGGWFELSVANGGAPIPAAQLTCIFEPFSRAKARPSMQGLGLGLYIAKKVAEAHGGTLEASIHEGKNPIYFANACQGFDLTPSGGVTLRPGRRAEPTPGYDRTVRLSLRAPRVAVRTSAAGPGGRPLANVPWLVLLVIPALVYPVVLGVHR